MRSHLRLGLLIANLLTPRCGMPDGLLLLLHSFLLLLVNPNIRADGILKRFPSLLEEYCSVKVRLTQNECQYRPLKPFDMRQSNFGRVVFTESDQEPRKRLMVRVLSPFLSLLLR